MGRGRGWGLAAVAACGAALSPAPPAQGATYEPTTTRDTNPGACTPRHCTLREAVIRANRHAGRDRVVLEAGRAYQLRRPGRNEDASATGDLDLNDDMVLKSGRGRRATIDANGIDRVIDAIREDPASIAISRLRIRGGRTEGFESGGGIRTGQGGVVRITRSDVRGNRASISGGGVATLNFGTVVRISRSTITRNRALTEGAFEGSGGGIHVTEDDVVLIASSVFENTATGSGGGLAQTNGGTVRIINSTIANNSANQEGGGVAGLFGSTTLASATVARNLANADGAGSDGGGGLFNEAATFTVGNSIVAENAVGAGGFGPDCWQSFAAPYTSAGVNLFSNLQDCSGFPEPPNIVDATPGLGAFGMHGGPTPTIALRAGSPAINAAGPGSPPRDQRGVRRINPDIGAYERR